MVLLLVVADLESDGVRVRFGVMTSRWLEVGDLSTSTNISPKSRCWVESASGGAIEDCIEGMLVAFEPDDVRSLLFAGGLANWFPSLIPSSLAKVDLGIGN